MRARDRVRRVLMAICLVAGIGLILYPVVGTYLNERSFDEVVSRYEETVQTLPEDERAEMLAEARAYNESLRGDPVHDPFVANSGYAVPDNYDDLLNVDGTGLMGTVSIPAIDLTLPLYHGTGDEVLQTGAGHIATTALPIDGESIHPVVTGHTGLPDKLLFTNLMFVQEGDVFRVKILDRTFSYRVASVDVVEPDDTALLQPVEGEDRLTLLTCTPYGINSQRLLITGVPTVEDDEQGARPLVLPFVVAGALLVGGAVLAWRKAGKRPKRP